ncbi:MAG: hydrolase, partial [Actinomycetes bacterium]
DKPAAACLASRVAFGLEVTPSRLARVERAEAALRAVLGDAGTPVTDLRVRDLGGTARVEVDPWLVGLVAGSREAQAAVLDAGYAEVEIDPRGFRSGSMNELLPDQERWR